MKPSHKPAKPRVLEARAKPTAGSPSVHPSPVLSRGRKWLFRLCAVLLVPALILTGLEGILRLAGYGFGTQFFIKVRAGAKQFLVSNDSFSLRFFPPELARFPRAVTMSAEKPAGVFRIFILGESAAMGDPKQAFGAGRYLEALLRQRYTEARFEVVNVAFTAINSHVILPIARECARQRGDLWIIYMGNNEMVGPFGAASAFGTQAPSLGFVRLSLALQQTRLGQLLFALGRKLAGKTPNVGSWAGMEMFVENRVGPADPRKETVYRNFSENLRDIVLAGLNSGAKIILNTVAVNLQDCPPFASESNSNLPPAKRLTCDRLQEEGGQQQQQGRFESAARSYQQAAELDPQCADLQFRWAQCLLQLTNFASAREHFQRACDRDALPFRADSRINDLIGQVGRQIGSPDLVVLDAPAALATNSPACICGQETFFEHVHFNFDGNYHLARAWAKQVERSLPRVISSHAAGPWASQEVCERRLGLTDWNRYFVAQTMLRRFHQPPLKSQANNARRVEALEGWEKELRGRMQGVVTPKVRELYAQAIEQNPDDHDLHESYANFLEATGGFKEATAQWQQVEALLPHDSMACFQVGRLLGQQGRWPEAQPYLVRALALRPSLAEAWFELGSAHTAEGQFGLALEDYEHAVRLRPKDAAFCCHLGKALSRMKRRAEAIQRFRQAILLQPDYWDAHLNLGNELALDDKRVEAEGEFAEVIRLRPSVALAHLNLGVLLVKQDRLDAALREFEETLRLEPGNRAAKEYQTRLQAWKSRDRTTE